MISMPDGQIKKEYRLLAVAGYDSFFRVNMLVAEHFQKAGATVDFCLLHSRRRQITSAQLRQFNIESKRIIYHTAKSLCSANLLSRYSVIIAALDGATFRQLFLRLEKVNDPLPLILAIYPGLVFRYHFDGLSSRTPADFLWLNSEQDRLLYKAMCDGYGIDHSNARVLGFPALLEPIEYKIVDNGPIVFFEQTVIPASIFERKFLALQLVKLAREHGHRRVLVKPRIRPNEFTLHKVKSHIIHHLQEAAKTTGGWPSNLDVVYTPPDQLLKNTAHCLTISSTVAIEAIHAGVPTSILADFGAHDDSGIHFFYGSGLIRTFESLDFEKPQKPNPDWVRKAIIDPTQHIDTLVAEILDAARLPSTYRNTRRRVAPTIFSNSLHSYLTKYFDEAQIAKRAYKRNSQTHSRKYKFKDLMWRMFAKKDI